jgi:hypothetical protein
MSLAESQPEERHPISKKLYSWIAWGTALALFTMVAYRVRHSVSGDASIYFTFFKNFFDLPFSYQSGTVSHGASSPLHVVVFAVVYHLFGQSWLVAGQILNFSFIFAGLVLLHKTLRLNVGLLPLLAGFVASFGMLMAVSAELFETGLVFFSISGLYYLIQRDRTLPAIIVAGLLHLVRPELILITFAVYFWILWRHRSQQHFFWMLGLGLFDLGYYGYMAANGAGWLPSSVVGRAVAAIENPMTWGERLFATVRHMGLPWRNPYWIGFAVFLVFVVVRARGKRLPLAELLILLPVAGLYFLVPPGVYIQRYLVPTIPILSVAFLWMIEAGGAWVMDRWGKTNLDKIVGCDGSPRAAWVFSVTLGLAMIQFYTPWTQGFYRVTHEEILLPDLAEVMNEIAGPEDNVLIYEIQGQYHLKARAIGMTVIGHQALDFLLKREPFEDLLEREKIAYIVTMNSFNYRHIYNDTALEALYAHDLCHPVGTSLQWNGWNYTKVATNPDFADPARYQVKTFGPMNVDNELRLFKEPSHRAGTHFLWNSIYKLERESPSSRPIAEIQPRMHPEEKLMKVEKS